MSSSLKLNKRILIFAIILGLITAVALNFYIKSLDKPALVAVPHSEVIIAKTTIPAYIRITEEMLDKQSMPSDAVHPEAITSMDNVVGGISKSEIIKGEQVLSGRVVMDETKATLSYRIPENMRAFTIPIGEVSGVAGFISPGDKVDILISYSDEKINDELTTYTMFQNMEILATGEQTQPKDDATRSVVSTLTLLVTPEEAEVLVYSLQSGTFHLTLRSPVDTSTADVDSFNSTNFDSFRER